MALYARFVTRRRDGREIVRRRDLAGDEVAIGRAPECGLQLNDLRVALHHARLVRDSQGRVELAAEARAPVFVDGRRVRRTVFDAARGQVVRIGPFALTLLAEGDDLRIDVERVEGVAPDLSGEAAEAQLSLRRSLPPKRALAWLAVAAVVAGFLAFPLWTFANRPSAAAPPRPAAAYQKAAAVRVAAGSMWSPGPLTHAHAFLAGDCTACHARSFGAVSDETCRGCHTGLADHADGKLMLRARPPPSSRLEAVSAATAAHFGKAAGRCADCHREHRGAAAFMTADQAFCTDCHKALDRRLGAQARLVDVGDFASAHPEFRPSVVLQPLAAGAVLTRRWSAPELAAAMRLRARLTPVGSAGCGAFGAGLPNFGGAQHLSERAAPALARAGDNSGLVFPHALHLASRGCVAALAHRVGVKLDAAGGLPCAACHTPDATGRRFAPVRMTAACSACHSLVFDTVEGSNRALPHGQPRQVVATLLAFYKGEAGDLLRGAGATDRHLPGQAALDRSAALRVAAFNGADQRTRERVRAVFSPGGACYGCHEVIRPPEGSLDFGVAPVRLQSRFLPHAAFDHKAHSIAGVTCEACHAARASQSAADVLTPAIATCRTCHGNAHAKAAAPSTCVTCHGFHGAGTPAAADVRPGVVRRASLDPWRLR